MLSSGHTSEFLWLSGPSHACSTEFCQWISNQLVSPCTTNSWQHNWFQTGCFQSQIKVWFTEPNLSWQTLQQSYFTRCRVCSVFHNILMVLVNFRSLEEQTFCMIRSIDQFHRSHVIPSTLHTTSQHFMPIFFSMSLLWEFLDIELHMFAVWMRGLVVKLKPKS